MCFYFQQDYYFIARKGKTAPSGRLYSKYTTIRSKRWKTCLTYTPSQQNIRKDCCEVDIEVCTALKAKLLRDCSDWNAVIDKWQKTCSLRRKELTELSISDFLKNCPKLTDARAPQLVWKIYILNLFSINSSKFWNSIAVWNWF